MAQNSTAYDLSRYEPNPAQKQAPELRVYKRASGSRAMSPIKVLFCMIMVVTVISGLIYNRVVLTELGDEINSVASELTILESEYVRLQSEYASAMSIKTIEQYAENMMGMSKITKSQIEYVVVSDGDVAEVKDTGSGSFLGGLEQIIGQIKEYLNL